MVIEVSGQLKKSGQVTLTAVGGVLTFETDHANQRWEVTSVVVSTNQAATASLVPNVTLAENTSTLATMSAGNNRGTTWNGNAETFTGLWHVGECDNMSVIWSPPAGQSGTPLIGVIASAVVSGTKYSRRG